MEIIWIRVVFDRSAVCFMSHFFVMACMFGRWQQLELPQGHHTVGVIIVPWAIPAHTPPVNLVMSLSSPAQFEDAEEDATPTQQGRPGRDATATYLDDETIVDPSIEAEENIAAVQVREKLEQMGLAGRGTRDEDAETEVGEDGLYVPTGQGGFEDDEEGIPESWSDYSDEYDYLYDEDGNPLDEGNIDDEDWEVAEGGEIFPLPRLPLLTIWQTLRSNTIECVGTSRSSAHYRPNTTAKSPASKVKQIPRQTCPYQLVTSAQTPLVRQQRNRCRHRSQLVRHPRLSLRMARGKAGRPMHRKRKRICGNRSPWHHAPKCRRTRISLPVLHPPTPIRCFKRDSAYRRRRSIRRIMPIRRIRLIGRPWSRCWIAGRERCW